jgi:hypothetical protein
MTTDHHQKHFDLHQLGAGQKENMEIILAD